MPQLGVVVPTLDEADHLPLLLADLEALTLARRVVIADGGSADDTVDLARRWGARIVTARTGRASQITAGVEALDGVPWLLLLHADSRLGPDALAEVEAHIARDDRAVAAHFRFRLSGKGWFWRFIEVGQRLRERLTGLAYGDQGLLVAHRHLREAGGVPEQPLMEDVELLLRLRRSGRIDRFRTALYTSPRRYGREGRWRAWLRNSGLIALYRLGVPAAKLAPAYPPRRAPHAVHAVHAPRRATDSVARTVMIFAKAPRPGTVKTRLATSIGDVEAATVYRRLGLTVVQGLSPGPYRTEVHFAPADAEPEVRAWLGSGPTAFVPQPSGDLGARMSAGFERAFVTSDAVCVVGTDTPGFGTDAIERAFAALTRHDLVLGPARDGGYWLLGLRSPARTLFEGVEWSTARVLTQTLAAARDAGLSWTLLEERADIDRPEDLEQ